MKFTDQIRARADRKNLYSKPDFWDGKAKDYDGSAVSMWCNRPLNALYEREQFAFIDAALPDVKGLSVLDVGCGTGRLARHMARRGANVAAFDFASEPIRIARETNPELKIEYSVMSTFDLDSREAYDAILVLGNLTVACQTADEAGAVFGLMFEALKPGGKLVLVEPFHDSFLTRVLPMSAKEVVDRLEKAGFSIHAREELHFWPARLPLSLREWPVVLTRIGYHIGQAALKFGGAALGMGDYKGIVAEKAHAQGTRVK